MKQRNNIPVITLPDFGKVPPQAVDIEEALIGTCLLYPDVTSEIRLKPEMFYKDAHQKIYTVILELALKGVVDILTVSNRLRDKQELESIGGPVYLSRITSSIYTAQNIEYQSLIIKEKYLKREYIRISTEIQNRSFDDSIDFADVIEYAETSLFEISDFTQSREPELLGVCVDEVLNEVDRIYNKEKELIGIPSGFTSIDRKTGGWQPGELIIIAGRPSMGKTALALTLSLNPARMNHPVAFFSLEMSRGQLATRYLSGESGYTNIEIRNADVNMEKLIHSSLGLIKQQIVIDDTSSIALFELRSKVKKQILKRGIQLVVVDYLQLMTAEAGNREQEISKISRGLKSIAKEFNIPVIALSQLNRDVEKRADKRPNLSDLRESGAIEQDADIVCFIYRPAHYGISSIKIDRDDISTESMMLIDCAKNRSGPIFSQPLYHNAGFTRITEDKPGFTEPF